jgi:hypothetical protein
MSRRAPGVECNEAPVTRTAPRGVEKRTRRRRTESIGPAVYINDLNFDDTPRAPAAPQNEPGAPRATRGRQRLHDPGPRAKNEPGALLVRAGSAPRRSAPRAKTNPARAPRPCGPARGRKTNPTPPRAARADDSAAGGRRRTNPTPCPAVAILRPWSRSARRVPGAEYHDAPGIPPMAGAEGHEAPGTQNKVLDRAGRRDFQKNPTPCPAVAIPRPAAKTNPTRALIRSPVDPGGFPPSWGGIRIDPAGS